jgi:hypothetical protein
MRECRGAEIENPRIGGPGRNWCAQRLGVSAASFREAVMVPAVRPDLKFGRSVSRIGESADDRAGSNPGRFQQVNATGDEKISLADLIDRGAAIERAANGAVRCRSHQAGWMRPPRKPAASLPA